MYDLPHNKAVVPCHVQPATQRLNDVNHSINRSPVGLHHSPPSTTPWVKFKCAKASDAIWSKKCWSVPETLPCNLFSRISMSMFQSRQANILLIAVPCGVLEIGDCIRYSFPIVSAIILGWRLTRTVNSSWLIKWIFQQSPRPRWYIKQSQCDIQTKFCQLLGKCKRNGVYFVRYVISRLSLNCIYEKYGELQHGEQLSILHDFRTTSWNLDVSQI